MTLRLVADAVFTVDADDTLLPPGAVEIDDGLISWVGDPWQVPAGRGDRGAPVGRPAHARTRQLPRALAHDAGAQRGRRPAARPLAERGGLAARGAAQRRGRLLGHGARCGRDALQRHHHDVRAVPAPGRRWPRRCSTRASGPSTRRGSSTCPGRDRSNAWEALLARGLRAVRRAWTAGRAGSTSASGRTPPTPCRPTACAPSRRRRSVATRCCRSTSRETAAECQQSCSSATA